MTSGNDRDVIHSCAARAASASSSDISPNLGIASSTSECKAVMFMTSVVLEKRLALTFPKVGVFEARIGDEPLKVSNIARRQILMVRDFSRYHK